MAMSAGDRAKAVRLLDEVQGDRVQWGLRAGFERDFTNSILLHWESVQHLSPRQLEILEEIVQRRTGG